MPQLLPKSKAANNLAMPAWDVHGKHFRSESQRAQYFGPNSIETNLRNLDNSAQQAARLGIDAVMSGEAMYHLTPDGMSRLKAFLLQYFNTITVVGFARPPMGFARSYAQEALKIRQTLDQILKTSPPTPKYKKRFGGYLETFGRENFRVAAFVPAEFPSHSSLRMFLRMIRAPVAEDLINEVGVDTHNTSMSMTAAKFLSLVNASSRNMKYDDYQKKILSPLKNLPGEPFQISAEIAERVLDECQSDLEWLKECLNIGFSLNGQSKLDLPPQSIYSKFEKEDVKEALFSLFHASE